MNSYDHLQNTVYILAPLTYTKFDLYGLCFSFVCICLFPTNITFESVVSAEEESDKDLNEVDAAMPLPSPPCFLSPSVLLTPLLDGVGVLLRDCAWLWGEGFFSFLKGSSITVGPPGNLGGPLEDDVQLDILGCS